MASPLCVVSNNGGSYTPVGPGAPLAVGAGDTIRVQLASPAGVNSWSLSYYGFDEQTLTSQPATPIFTPGPPGIYTMTFPAATGRAVGFQSVINGGRDVNNNVAPAYTTTFALFTLAGNTRVLFTGQTFETNLAGWIADINGFLRAFANSAYGGMYANADDAVSLSLLAAGTPVVVPMAHTLATAKNTSVASNQLTAATAGALVVRGTASFTALTGPTQVNFQLYQNGVAIADALAVTKYAAGEFATVSIVTLVTAAAGDKFDLRANTVGAGGALSLAISNAELNVNTPSSIGPKGDGGGGGGSIGSGPTGALQSGVLALPKTTTCIAVDLTSVDATADFSTITSPTDGLAIQFDLVKGTKALILQNANFIASGSGATPETTFSAVGGGQSVVVKYNAAAAVWNVW